MIFYRVYILLPRHNNVGLKVDKKENYMCTVSTNAQLWNGEIHFVFTHPSTNVEWIHRLWTTANFNFLDKLEKIVHTTQVYGYEALILCLSVQTQQLSTTLNLSSGGQIHGTQKHLEPQKTFNTIEFYGLDKTFLMMLVI